MKQQRSRRPQEARLAPASSSLASRPFSPDSAVATVARPAAAPHQFHGVAVRNVSPMVQPKLTLGQPDDRFEREAEQIATALVSRPRLERTLQQPTTQVQRSGGATGIAISPALEASINSARGQGQAMPATVQRSMEAAFGADFSGVRVHVDSQAHQLSQAVQAQAFTTGNDIFFRQGHYNPGSRDGQHLLAHELTHVVQQGGSTVQAQTIQRKNFTQEALDDYDDYNEALDDYEEDEEAETPGKHPSDVTVWNFVHQAIHQEGARKVESRTGLGDAHIEEGMIGTLYPEPVADKEKGKASQITVDPKLQPLVRDVQRIQAGLDDIEEELNNRDHPVTGAKTFLGRLGTLQKSASAILLDLQKPSQAIDRKKKRLEGEIAALAGACEKLDQEISNANKKSTTKAAAPATVDKIALSGAHAKMTQKVYGSIPEKLYTDAKLIELLGTFAASEGEQGIKVLKGKPKGGWTHELKFLGILGDQRAYGKFDPSDGKILFTKFGAGLH